MTTVIRYLKIELDDENSCSNCDMLCIPSWGERDCFFMCSQRIETYPERPDWCPLFKGVLTDEAKD